MQIKLIEKHLVVVQKGSYLSLKFDGWHQGHSIHCISVAVMYIGRTTNLSLHLNQ